MKYRETEIRNWHVLLGALILIFAISAITIVTMRQQEIDLLRTKVTQEEKSERGHWLWGHWDDVAEKDDE